MAKIRVVLLVHETLIPPDTPSEGPTDHQTEQDVKQALLALGHDVLVVGVYDDLAPLRQAIDSWQPDIVFNLLEEFAGNPAFDYYVVSYLEMLGIPYTGCNPRGLMLARDKALSKILLAHHRIRVPAFHVYRYGRSIRPTRQLSYPMIVKSLIHEGSFGIAQASVVNNDEQLIERVQLIHNMTRQDAIAEQYIEGRELYLTLTGNTRLTNYPLRELVFGKNDPALQTIATHRVKWNQDYRKRWKINYRFAHPLPDGMEEKIKRLGRRICRILDLNGYVRLDLRLTDEQRLYVLEANPNPGIATDEDSTLSVLRTGLDYPQFIQKIINLGLSARQETCSTRQYPDVSHADRQSRRTATS